MKYGVIIGRIRYSCWQLENNILQVFIPRNFSLREVTFAGYTALPSFPLLLCIKLVHVYTFWPNFVILSLILLCSFSSGSLLADLIEGKIPPFFHVLRNF